MNRTLKIFGIIVFLVFSFYYTHEFATLSRKNDPIYETILMKQEEKNLASVNAIIDDDYITPGLTAKKVNVQKSFQRMKNMGSFIESYLVFDEIPPDVSTSNNPSKIIKNGNKEKMGVAIVIPENSELQSYFEKSNINYTILTTKATVNEEIFGERINADYENYKVVEKELSKQDKNKNICFLLVLDKDFCISKKKFLVLPTITLSNSNVASMLTKVKSGDIIYIKNLDRNYLQLLMENIVYKGYTFYFLSELLSETR